MPLSPHLTVKHVFYFLLSDKYGFKLHTSGCVCGIRHFLWTSVSAHKIRMITPTSKMLTGANEMMYVKAGNMVSNIRQQLINVFSIFNLKFKFLVV